MFVAVSAFAGTRRGETSAIRVSDSDFLRKELRVERLVQWTEDGRMQIRPPKYGSERTIYVPDGLVTILAEYVRVHRPSDDPTATCSQEAVTTPCPRTRPPLGGPGVSPARRPKVEYRLHDCRHFLASGLIHAGCDVVTVQRALGHSSPSITLDIYGHLWPNAADRTRTALQGLVDAVLSGAADGGRKNTL